LLAAYCITRFLALGLMKLFHLRKDLRVRCLRMMRKRCP
jgi:hypothetical protein